MTVIRLKDKEKEEYLYNLISAVNLMVDNIDKDGTIKKSEWDINVYMEITRILKNSIIPLFQLLQKTEDFGVYDEVILSNGGLPEFLNYMQLSEDKNNANTKIEEILSSYKIDKKEELPKIWLQIAKNPLIDKEEKRKLLDKIPEKYKAIEFYQKLDKIDIYDIRKSMDGLYIKSLGGKEERYTISWFNYVTGSGVWNIYVAQIKEIDPEKKGIFSIFKKDIPSYGFFRPTGAGIEISPMFRKFLEDSISSGPFFLAREMDNKFSTIYPEKISMFQLGPFYINGIKTGSLDLSWLFVRNPKSYLLTAIREDIENGGIEDNNKNKNDIYKNKKTKCIWRADKLTEQRFGISSKDLEMFLKDHVKFPEMRFYVN